MHSTSIIPDDLLTLATEQARVVSRPQALNFGVPPSTIRRKISQESWTRLLPGTYLLGTDPSWRSWAWAGLLKGGDESFVGGMAAAHAWGLVDEPPGTVDILVPYSKRARNDGCVVFRKRKNLPNPYSGFRLQPLPETILDLCAVQPQKAAYWVSQGRHVNKHLSLESIRKALSERSRFPHREELENVISDNESGVESKLEKIYLERVEKAHNLPTASRQARGLYRLDNDYGPLIVELDGRAGHQGPGTFRDMQRDNYHQLLNKVTLRYGWDDCNWRPCQVAKQVARALLQSKVPCDFRPCRLCVK
ncbi:type IV toxin-antitoxin system AbiEi family antitoxin domain-containing protein [Propionimicrobium lymphophilum]|uniref:type IV toxin-antitoxin system AbiEi family antitoxin domain-containing protein n=1 Tax=Propionimicrobium lymphophilum TaxID=33012 RepID=UPI00254DDCC8|nr:type IV toxin-antitoxin system AbiEi family antitoxin domain-containing protein [Propionimicrobium lymphophilum]MDK7710478.1 type IV toxin-antitoxin system AbiEi family antitoxin domain-containing protein [Propionimicrobium lymphophilum]MDK7734500.1 type IV toxin-antitoxin system AbiEi family antitoxin domain-containing protein [Propionimicrobium lymphophilum]